MILQANDIQYFVEMKGEGTPVVFLHGFTGDTTTWSRITDKFSANYKCILIDILGHGKTDSPQDPSRYTMDAVSADLFSICTQLDIKKAIFIGYSMGGRLALHFSFLHPQFVEALVLESSSPGLKTEEERLKRRETDLALADRIMKNGIESFVDYWEEIPLFSSQKKLPEPVQNEIRNQRLGQSPLGLANSLKGMGTGAQPSWWNKLNTLPFPVTLLVGGKDEKFIRIAKEMKETNPDFQIKTILDTGHAIHVEEPQKFGTIIEELLLTTYKGG